MLALLFNLSSHRFEQASTDRGCIDKCSVEILDPCKDEIQPHLHTNSGNIEQIFKTLKGQLFSHIIHFID